MTALRNQIKQIQKGILAIGFQISPNQVSILGSGFAVSKDGKILSVAHLYEQIPNEHKAKLGAMVMTQEASNGIENFSWFPLKLIDGKKKVQDDLALYQLEGYEKTLLQPLDLGDSNIVEVGDETYFVGYPYALQLLKDGFGITRIVNRGIISNVKHDGIDPSHKRNWMIVDAISNPGNSGCPLIDAESNKVIGVMSISFRIQSQTNKELDIREPMHIAGAKPINLAKDLLSN